MINLSVRVSSVLAAVLATAFAAPAVGLAQAAVSAADEAAVRRVEDRRIQALIDDDFATLESIFGDDLTYTHSNALVDTKASYMESLRSGRTKYETVERQPSDVRLYGDSAVMTGQATMRLRGQPAPIVLRYTLVYVRRGGAWRMVAWQSTRLPQA